jgi:hypothetical protein
MELKPILAAHDVPMAVHGTNMQAWKSIGAFAVSTCQCAGLRCS